MPALLGKYLTKTTEKKKKKTLNWCLLFYCVYTYTFKYIIHTQQIVYVYILIYRVESLSL